MTEPNPQLRQAIARARARYEKVTDALTYNKARELTQQEIDTLMEEWSQLRTFLHPY